ncbi:hypothetical protein E2C01_059303 [Portunus trituberculatus]|uniref:Uncharacterized protein n=1 Tax=Portunus trituberculatus TaxID=210409 RepID=A0A5B7H260_PORTR|nr:hypothetical protein [Portunus trituberculatus]
MLNWCFWSRENGDAARTAPTLQTCGCEDASEEEAGEDTRLSPRKPGPRMLPRVTNIIKLILTPCQPQKIASESCKEYQ